MQHRGTRALAQRFGSQRRPGPGNWRPAPQRPGLSRKTPGGRPGQPRATASRRVPRSWRRSRRPGRRPRPKERSSARRRFGAGGSRALRTKSLARGHVPGGGPEYLDGEARHEADSVSGNDLRDGVRHGDGGAGGLIISGSNGAARAHRRKWRPCHAVGARQRAYGSWRPGRVARGRVHRLHAFGEFGARRAPVGGGRRPLL